MMTYTQHLFPSCFKYLSDLLTNRKEPLPFSPMRLFNIFSPEKGDEIENLPRSWSRSPDGFGQGILKLKLKVTRELLDLSGLISFELDVFFAWKSEWPKMAKVRSEIRKNF